MQNLGGTVGHYLAMGLLYVVGFAAYIPVLFALVYGVLLFMDRRVHTPVLKTLGVVVFTAMIALLLAGPSGKAGVSEEF